MVATLPISPAAAHATDRACARHPDLLAARYCTECAAPLCSACARHRPHKICPQCADALGKPAFVADVGWYVALLADGVVHASTTLRARVLPFTSLLSLAFAGGLLALFLGADVDVEDTGAAAGVAILGLLLAFTVSAWAQPAFEMPTLPRVPTSTKLRRAMWGGVLPFVAFVGVFSVAGAGGALLEGDGALAVLGAVLVAGASLAALFVVMPFMLPIQAACALRRAPVVAALSAPFSGGWVPVLSMLFLHGLLLVSALSFAYALFLPLIVVAVFSLWLAGLSAVVLSVVALSAMLLVTAAYGTASLRFAEDRARVRRKH